MRERDGPDWAKDTLTSFDNSRRVKNFKLEILNFLLFSDELENKKHDQMYILSYETAPYWTNRNAEKRICF